MENTEEELKSVITQMRTVSNMYYRQAIHVNPQNHAFIEFCGLINEYIQICNQTLENGIDFTTVSTHSKRGKLIIADHNIAYLEEKLNCIFDNVLDINLTKRVVNHDD